MTYPVFIRGDTLAFSRKVLLQNERTTQIDVEALYTPFGFVVPLNYWGLSIVDYFEHGASALKGIDAESRAVIITSDGVVRLHAVASSTTFSGWKKYSNSGKETTIAHTVTRLLLSPATDWCRSACLNTELVAAAAMALHPKLEDAVQTVGKVKALAMDAYHFTTISDCVQALKKRGTSKTFPYAIPGVA